MKKAVISNRIYMSVSEEQKKEIDKELTYAIPSYNPSEPPFIIKNMSIIRKELVSFPSGRTDLIPEDYEVVHKELLVPVEFPEFKFKLRPSQQEVYDDIKGSCVINAWVSWGKTFTGLAIAGKLGQKTLVVTHTVALRDQWCKKIEEVFGITAGVIGSGRFELDGPIVVGNTQTLYKNLNKINKTFGTLILDEMHHTSSNTFSKIIDSSHAKYKIGLSGTIERKDGKHVVFKDYFGHKLYQPPKENYMVPRVVIHKADIWFSDGKGSWADKVTELLSNPDYRDTVALLASYFSARNHKVLVVADRVEFLHACAGRVGERAICVTGGPMGVAHQDREAIIKRLYTDVDQLYGTQSIFSEGFSEDILSCLILGTPVNNEPLLTQLIGRVIREYKGKSQPVIVDINLKGGIAGRQAMNRLGYYMKQGYEITYV